MLDHAGRQETQGVLPSGACSPPGVDFRRQYAGVFRSGVAEGAEDPRVGEPGRPELIEEGAALLRSRDSGEPVRLAGTNVGRQRFRQDQLGDVRRRPAPQHAVQFPENALAVRVEVEDAVDHGDIE